MKIDHFIYPWEKKVVLLRHFEDLTREQIAGRLDLRFAQVKYIFSKVNVKHYVQTQILPSFWKQEIAELEEKLADPVGAYVEYLIKCSKAQTYIWVGPGQKLHYSNNKIRMRALSKVGRIYGITGDQKTANRDLEKAIFKHAAKLEERLQLLQTKLAEVQNMN